MGPTSFDRFTIATNDGTNLLQYCASTDEWTIFVENVKANEIIPNICMDAMDKRIYMISEMNTISSIDSTTLDVIKHSLPNIGHGPYSALIAAESDIHIIAGFNNDHHFIWNDKRKEFKHVHTFNDLKSTGWTDFGLVFTESKREFLCFGGIKFLCKPLDEIWRYSLQSKTWTLLNVRLPKRMSGCGCVLLEDQNYVILLGGHRLDSIYVFDVDAGTFHECKIKLPFSGYCKAVLMHDCAQNRLLIHGYCRGMIVPFDLMSLLMMYHWMDYIHILNAKHFK